MLHSVKDLENYTIGAADGLMGQVTDLYVDDAAWVIRYLVVRLGGDADRKVLISPISIGRYDWAAHILPVKLTQAQIRHSPDIDTDKPVSRQQEMGFAGYYGYGQYWGGGGLWGAGLYPDILEGGLQPLVAGSKDARPTPDDPHLRSVNALMRYYVHASDGDIGHVAGFLVDESSWAIRYIVVNTSNWWVGHQVILAPQWIDAISWTESKVSFDLTRDMVRHAPAYDGRATLDPAQEAAMLSHYGRAPQPDGGISRS